MTPQDSITQRIVNALQSVKTPLSIKWFAAAAVLYPLSPINVIPLFPDGRGFLVLGLIDDLFLLVFAGLALYHAGSPAPSDMQQVKKQTVKRAPARKNGATKS